MRDRRLEKYILRGWVAAPSPTHGERDGDVQSREPGGLSATSSARSRVRPPRSPEWTDTREAPGQGGEEQFADTAWDRDHCGPPHLLAGEIPPNQLHGEPKPNPAGPSRGEALQPRVLPLALAAPRGPGVGRSPRPALGDQCTSHHTDTRWVPRRSTPAWGAPKTLGPCPQGSGAMPLGIAANFPGNFQLLIPGSGVGPSLSG